MILLLQVVGGLVLLFLGGEFLVRGAVSLARRMGVSPLIIGLSVIAAGTSAPELVVSLLAALEDRPGIAVGNVIGSNIANILLVLGTAALIFPIARNAGSVRRDGSVLLGATGIFALLALTGQVTHLAGILMVGLLIGYLVSCYMQDRRNTAAAREREKEVEEFSSPSAPIAMTVFMLLLGFVGVLGGSELLVTGAVGVATKAGVSETVIGTTLVALGTSLPELAASISAAKHRQIDMAIGNVIGSCIFNLLGIMGTVGAVTAIRISEEILVFDLWAMVAVTIAFVGVTLCLNKITRPLAVGMLILYLLYIGAQFAGWSAMPAMAGG
jgi:cation:H+ antiporter